MNPKHTLVLSIIFALLALVLVTIGVTEILSSQIFFSIFIGFPLGVFSAIIVFFLSQFILKKNFT